MIFFIHLPFLLTVKAQIVTNLLQLRRMISVTHNWCPSKVDFRASVESYAITLARKSTFDGQQLYIVDPFKSIQAVQSIIY